MDAFAYPLSFSVGLSLKLATVGTSLIESLKRYDLCIIVHVIIYLLYHVYVHTICICLCDLRHK